MEKLKITTLLLNTHFYLCFYNITVLLLLLTSLVVFAEEELEPKSNLLYDSQLSTLLSIKSSLIDPFNNLSDWKPVQTAGAPSYCNWTGISCDPHGFVQSLDLSNMNLTGNISGDIQGLRRSLRFLNLSCNGFSSILPGSISNLTSLVTIDLSDNNFFGGFPLGFGEASGLKHLNASSNNFSGELPEDLGSGGDNNDSVLETLDFRGSFFVGSVPRSWMNLKRLKFLGLSGNNLTGNIPPEIGQLRSLERIILGYNEFEGEIPKELGNLTELRYLDFAVGSLSGAIPAELGKLKKLTTIYLFGNTFTGNIPPEIGNASALVYLDLSDNQLSGKIPDEIAQLKNLQLLNLMRNQLSGPIPSEIGNKLTKLQVLELWQNSLTGSLPEKLGTNSPLQWLDVSSNLLSGEIPGGLCDLGNLTKLIFFNNSFSGSLPGSLSRCSSLVRVRGQDNHISGTIPVGLGNLPKLQRLELSNNNLTGEIPHDFTLSMSLSFIDVSSNYLESSLPSSIFAMPSLQTFVASNNRLEGDLPSQFQDSPCLSVLDLSFNHFSGEIPGSIASFEKLVTLNLSHNELTGHIPKSMANMPTLSVLDLSNNSLVGRIPESFGSSPALETLDLAYNKLEGPVPNNGILMTINANDLTGNHGLCGGVLSPCSTQTTGEGMRSSRAAHVHRLVIGLALGVSAILGFAMVVFTGRWLYRRWFLLGDGLFWDCMFGKSNNLEWPWRLISFQRLSFTGADIMACLKESNVIGMGGSGIVYKAQPHGHSPAVAVKKLWRSEVDEDIEKCGGAAADELFVEVNLLGRLRHRNIVRLLGYLHNESDVMMVYEYMPNGNLGEALHGKQSGKVLVDWVSRYNVAVGVAYGLAYLHHDCRPPVIHRDIKSNNILLDEKFEARIADFGLARTMLRKNETVSMVAGSYGYIAPEYGYSLKVDEKSDIYSFGVVLLELLTGKQPLDPAFGDSSDIVDWVCTRINKRAAEETLDPEIAGQCKHVQEEMLLVLRIALVCTAKLPKDRPSMRDVITMLGEAKPRRKSICESRVYTSSTNKEQPIFSNSPVSGLL